MASYCTLPARIIPTHVLPKQVERRGRPIAGVAPAGRATEGGWCCRTVVRCPAAATNQNKNRANHKTQPKTLQPKNTPTQKKRQNNQHTTIVRTKQTKPRTQSPELGQFLCSCRPSDRWQTTNQTNHHHAANTPHHKKTTKPTQYNNQFKSKTGAMGRRVHHTAGNT